MSITISITDQDVFTALRSFLASVLPTGTEIVQAQDNRVSMPAGEFVSMNNVGTKRLETNTDTYTDPGTNPGTKAVLTPMQYTVQLDFYGVDSGSWANMVQSLFRDDYAISLMPANIQPLYADDPIQMPLIDGEQQYEQRWKLEAVLQTNPVTSVPQDFADAATIDLISVDATYPV